jgi:hypothetical protein
MKMSAALEMLGFLLYVAFITMGISPTGFRMASPAHYPVNEREVTMSSGSGNTSAWHRARRCVAMTLPRRETANTRAYSPLVCIGLLLAVALMANLGL